MVFLQFLVIRIPNQSKNPNKKQKITGYAGSPKAAG